jgi:hypothetical protein
LLGAFNFSEYGAISTSNLHEAHRKTIVTGKYGPCKHNFHLNFFNIKNIQLTTHLPSSAGVKNPWRFTSTPNMSSYCGA